MKKWNLPLTYKPKIERVRNGTIRQTIRLLNPKCPKKVGDLIRFYGRSGRPYHSKHAWKTEYFVIKDVLDMEICKEGTFNMVNITWVNTPLESLNEIAAKDGIEPPEWDALEEILAKMHGDLTGKKFQIIRW